MPQPRLVSFLLFAAAVAVTTGSARAQVLADRVPADAVAYAGWAGSDALGPAYDASHLKTFIETFNLPGLVSQRLQAATARVNDPGNADNIHVLQDLFAALAKAPTALYIGPADFSNPNQPMPKLALFSKVGAAQALNLADRVSALMAQRRAPNGPPSGAIAVDDFLLIYAGDAKFPERLSGPAPERSLSHEDAFSHAIAQLGPDAAKSAAVVYADGHAFVQLLGSAVQMSNNAQVRDYFPAISDGAGLTGLKQFAWAGNFDGADWKTSTFLGLRDRRNGLLAFLDNKPLSDDSLKLIPKSATTAGTVRFDGPRLLDDITAAAAKLNDQAPKQIESVLTQAYIWTGIDLKRELLPAFGDEFVYYGSPAAAGNSLRGFTLFNRLKDAKKAESAVSAVENFINLLVLQRNPTSKLQFQTQKLPAPWDAVTAHVLTLPQATPCWAINGDVFYFSLSLPGLQSALDMGAGNKPSILDNPQFTALRKLPGPGFLRLFLVR